MNPFITTALFFVCSTSVVSSSSHYTYRQYGDSDIEHQDYYTDNYQSNYDYNSDYSRYYNDYYHSPRERSRLRGAKSYKPRKPKREKVFVPVVIKKKSKKKSKFINVQKGFYVPGGTQIFGKFKDIFSCKKACELTPTCFAGDFNPWLGKCYFHSNLTACVNMKTHKSVIHFTKVPCELLETTRGYIVLGVSVLFGIEVKGIDNLQDCIKKCATAGNGIAATAAEVNSHPQVCCHLDYDFASHKCFMHACVDEATTLNANFCPNKEVIVGPPLHSIANAGAISITLCPIAP